MRALTGVALVSPPTNLDQAKAARALAAFRISLRLAAAPRRHVRAGQRRRLGRRLRRSGDASPDATRRAFSITASTGSGSAPARAFATGYYEPEIAGSRVRGAGLRSADLPHAARPHPLHPGRRRHRARADRRRPAAACSISPAPRSRTGRWPARGLEIAWAADPVELFFLQIQGSGRVRLPDGSVMRIGYDNQNGREYVAIGRLLRERGVLPPGGASMQAIVDWMRANPDAGQGADAREFVLHLLQGVDRAGAARRARPAGHAAARRSRPIRCSCRWARRCS